MLERFSIGTGDRFGQQGNAQLLSIIKARKEHDVLITPVWNKSNREHEIIGTEPQDVRNEADSSTNALGWNEVYCVDADHITKETVEPFISCSDFFTIDVAEYIGKQAEAADKESFLQKNAELVGSIKIPDLEEEFRITNSFLNNWADQYLLAIKKAQEIFEYIWEKKSGDVVFEISMDEVETPQTPIELYFILITAAEEGIKIDTIAPKFTGDFYKGIDYAGDIEQFVKEFEQDILAIKHAVNQFDLSSELKLSIHSGSDKFSLYPHINNLLEKHGAGVHLKTSGTTWLAELIGLATSGTEGLAMVKEIYRKAYGRYDELTAPYKPVISIDENQLPAPETFNEWSGDIIASKLEHNPDHPEFNPQLRQFLHCSYKIAAEQGQEFLSLLKNNEPNIAQKVTQNLYQRHIKPLFID